jgi:hypothetical protein
MKRLKFHPRQFSFWKTSKEKKIKRVVRKILKKYLDDAYYTPEDDLDFNTPLRRLMDKLTRWTPDIAYPPIEVLNGLCEELVVAIRGIESKDLFLKPSREEAEKWAEHHAVMSSPKDRYHDEEIKFATDELMKWLESL